MPTTRTKTIIYVEENCYLCGIDFMMPDWFEKRAREVGSTFHCPAGHGQVYRKSEVVKLREQVQRLEARNTHLADQAAAAERSASAARGQTTKLRKRIANGVCPCCKRSFANLQRHMSGQHPDYVEADHA